MRRVACIAWVAIACSDAAPPDDGCAPAAFQLDELRAVSVRDWSPPEGCALFFAGRTAVVRSEEQMASFLDCRNAISPDGGQALVETDIDWDVDGLVIAGAFEVEAVEVSFAGADDDGVHVGIESRGWGCRGQAPPADLVALTALVPAGDATIIPHECATPGPTCPCPLPFGCPPPP